MDTESPVNLWPDSNALGTLTDLYQLTMMAGYESAGMSNRRATFEVFVRRLPKSRSFLVFAGLEQAVGDLLRLAFSDAQVEAIRNLPVFQDFDPGFFDALRGFRFRGDVWAVAEGTIVFAGEPLVRVQGTLAEAQVVETMLLASLGYPTLVASKAARVVIAAQGRGVFDFGARRAHGPYAGLLGARASYLAGCDGTSNVEAAIRLGIPAMGTMAHSWVQAFDDEREAFSTFARLFPNASTLLVDTYDTLNGVRLAAGVKPPINAVRLDSGDPLALSRQARSILDGEGRPDVRIIASGDLDEFEIDRLVASGAPIDAFGVGTEMITSRDAPALSMVYKLVELDGVGRIKLSANKKTYPRAKQVFRFLAADGTFERDLVARCDEAAGGEAMLTQVVKDGDLVAPLPRLEAVRDHRRKQVEALPGSLKNLTAADAYWVDYSDLLEADAAALMESHRTRPRTRKT